ncbi:MAG: hypothetical protein WKG06_47305 [Segetibacter sp.]
MKNLFVTALLTVTLFANSFAAAPKKVNSAILEHFNAKFKKASDVTWLVTNEYTKAAFTAADTNMEVYYNLNGDIIGTSRSISLEELPIDAKRNFAKRFAGYEVKEAIRFEGFDEAAYYISGENEKENIILKVNGNNQVSLFKKTKK